MLFTVKLSSSAFPETSYAPTQATMHAFHFTASSNRSSQTFALVDYNNSPSFHIFTYPHQAVGATCRIGFNPKAYIGYWFCMERASCAYQWGIPLHFLKAPADWQCSWDTILIYLTMLLNIRLRSTDMFSKAICPPLTLACLLLVILDFWDSIDKCKISVRCHENVLHKLSNNNYCCYEIISSFFIG